MDGFYKPCTIDRNKNGGGIIIFIVLETRIFQIDVEDMFVVLNFKKMLMATLRNIPFPISGR